MHTTRADEHQRGTRLGVLALISDAESVEDGDRPARGRVKILRAADAFDRRDHVMSAEAYQLHVKAVLSSAALDHPGFVPDEYLASLSGEDLHSPGSNPAILATELCSGGIWRRTDGGHRVLDWPAVQAAIDHVRELRTVDRPARARALAAGLSRAGPVTAQPYPALTQTMKVSVWPATVQVTRQQPSRGQYRPDGWNPVGS